MTQTGTFQISQINSEESNGSYQPTRRSMIVHGIEALEMKRAMWREQIRNTPNWTSDYLRVTEVN